MNRIGYFYDPASWSEFIDISKRLQSIYEDVLSNSGHSDKLIPDEKYREELNAYKVKIENFFSDTEDMVPWGIKE